MGKIVGGDHRTDVLTATPEPVRGLGPVMVVVLDIAGAMAEQRVL
jgi:hypothetical protein